MSQINSEFEDDIQYVLQLSCFVGHPLSEEKTNLDCERACYMKLGKTLVTSSAVKKGDILTHSSFKVN